MFLSVHIIHRATCVFTYTLEVFTNVQQCKYANTSNFVLPVSLEMSKNANPFECQPSFLEWLVMVGSKFNKFEYVWSGWFCTWGACTEGTGTCQEVPGQGPSTEGTGTLSSRVARALYLDSHVDRQIE